MSRSEKAGWGTQRWEALLRLADSLGNISEACRQSGVARHTFYQWKRKSGPDLDAATLKPAGPPRRHPQAIPSALEREIVELALENPEWGCDRLAYFLKLHGKSVSSPTVQKVLIRGGLGRKALRMRGRDHR